MPFPSQVIVTLEEVESFSCPPGEFRDIMTGQLKISFGRKLQPEIWGDLEADLWASVQRLTLFKKLRLRVKLKSMTENKEEGHFNFKVFFTKRPAGLCGRWEMDDEDEEAPLDVIFCMEVTAGRSAHHCIRSSSCSPGLATPDDLELLAGVLYHPGALGDDRCDQQVYFG